MDTLRPVGVVTVLLTAALASCGGGSGSDAQPVTISNLSFSPAGAYENSGNGTVTVSGSMSFSAPSGNVSSVSVTVINPDGQNLGTSMGAAQGAAGKTNGSLQLQGSVSTTTLGKFTFQIAVIDSSGQSSNTLDGTFTIAPVPWMTQQQGPALRGGTVVAVNGTVYELGLNGTTPVGWTYDPNSAAWAQNGPVDPIGRWYAALAALNGVIYVVGGDFPENFDTGMTVVEAYDVAQNAWTTLAPLNTGRGQDAAVALNGQIYAIAGYNNGQALNTVEIYNPANNTWTLSPHTLASTAGSVSAAALNGTIVVTDENGHVDQYDPASDTWSGTYSLQNGTVSAALATDGKGIYAFGGLNDNLPTTGVQYFNPAVIALPIVKAAMPTAIGDPAAVAAGANILIIDPTTGTTLQYTPAGDIF